MFFFEKKRFRISESKNNRLLTNFDPNDQKPKDILHFTSKIESFEINRNRIPISTESLGTTAIWRLINSNSAGILLKNVFFQFRYFLEIVYFEI